MANENDSIINIIFTTIDLRNEISNPFSLFPSNSIVGNDTVTNIENNERITVKENKEVNCFTDKRVCAGCKLFNIMNFF